MICNNHESIQSLVRFLIDIAFDEIFRMDISLKPKTSNENATYQTSQLITQYDRQRCINEEDGETITGN